jgi:preprotein translocase subunit SecY
MSLWTRALTDGGLLQRLASVDTRRRILFTLLILAVARCLSWAPLPGVDLNAYAQLIGQAPGPIGAAAIERLSVAALGLGPYVSMWVLMEIFRGGRDEASVERIRLIGAALMAAFQAYGVAVGLEAAQGVVLEPGLAFRASTVVTLLAGSLLLIWLGTQITRRGLGPGVWVLFAAGIVADLPASARGLFELVRNGSIASPFLLGVIALAVAVVALIVLVETAERRVPTLSITAGEPPVPAANQHLAFPLDHVTILPAYLASTLLTLPVTVVQILYAGSQSHEWLARLVAAFRPGEVLYLAFYAALIFAATFVLTAMRVRLDVWAARLAREQRTIAGVAAPQAESTLDGILTRLTVLVALYLVVIALLPEIMISYAALPFYIGGTSYLIVVLVALRILRDVSGAGSTPTSAGAAPAPQPPVGDVSV